MTEKKVPHIHAELLKQWADGAEIQYFNGVEWEDTDSPCWVAKQTYRIKPEPKPDVILYAFVEKNDWKNMQSAEVFACQADTNKTHIDTVMFVFDGETGELKDAQVLARV